MFHLPHPYWILTINFCFCTDANLLYSKKIMCPDHFNYITSSFITHIVLQIPFAHQNISISDFGKQVFVQIYFITKIFWCKYVHYDVVNHPTQWHETFRVGVTHIKFIFYWIYNLITIQWKKIDLDCVSFVNGEKYSSCALFSFDTCHLI